MKLLFTYLIFTTICFSQNEVFTVAQIDSIAEVNGSYAYVHGKIIAEKRVNTKTKNGETEIIIKGNGGSATITYLNFYNKGYYNNLTREEKKRYNEYKDSELVKGGFNQNITYEDKSGESIAAQFYYYRSVMFFVRVRYTVISDTGKEESQEFSLTAAEIEDPKPIKNTLLFDVKPWIKEKNEEILKHHKQ